MSEVKRFSKEILIRKMLVLVLVIYLYFTLMFWLLAPGIFADPFDLWIIIIFYIFGTIDIIIRPVPEGKPKMDKCATAIVLLGFLQPFILAVAYYENLYLVSPYLTFWNDPIVAYIGIFVLIIGGIITIISRVQLGIFALPVLIIEEEHQLITNGIYSKLRHPMYTGAMLSIIGPFMGFRSFIVLILISIFNFWLLILRMNREEKMLISAFGEKYETYMKRTKRMIPFIY